MHDNLSFYFKTGSSKFVDFFLPILPSYSYDAINKVVLDFGDLVCTEIRETPKLEKKNPVSLECFVKINMIFLIDHYRLNEFCAYSGIHRNIPYYLT